MDRPDEDDRSALAIAWGWATAVMAIAAEMVVPGLIGVWVDRLLGTLIVFGLVGFALGIAMAIFHLVRMTQASAGPIKRSDKRPPQA